MEKIPHKRVIVIAGPTAVGKTATAIAVAKQFHTEIISADSRQCYRELNIGVARPSREELAEVPHHFIATHSIHEEITAAEFERYALEKVRQLFQRHDTVVMTGGTGLYIRAFCEGLDPIPSVPPAIREAIIQQYETNGIGWLQEQVKLKDPVFFETGEWKNPQRLMRALEVIEATGQPVHSFRKGLKADREFKIVKLGLELPREELYHRIHQRVDQMMEAGLLDEVRSLLPFKKLNALQTVGYSELFNHLDGLTTLDRAIELIKQHTRHYAKRQLTWFKRDSEMSWINAADAAIPAILSLLK